MPCNCELIAEMDLDQLEVCECNIQYLTACCQALPTFFEDTLVCKACYGVVYEYATEGSGISYV